MEILITDSHNSDFNSEDAHVSIAGLRYLVGSYKVSDDLMAPRFKNHETIYFALADLIMFDGEEAIVKLRRSGKHLIGTLKNGKDNMVELTDQKGKRTALKPSQYEWIYKILFMQTA